MIIHRICNFWNQAYLITSQQMCGYQDVRNVRFRKIWRAWFSSNTRYDIRPFALLPTIYHFKSNFYLHLNLSKFLIRVFKCMICVLNVPSFWYHQLLEIWNFNLLLIYQFLAFFIKMLPFFLAWSFIIHFRLTCLITNYSDLNSDLIVLVAIHRDI